jgi:peptidoglycan/LPS O-acetylase OafA/YrhL
MALPQHEGTTSRDRLPGLDGLRALAASSIVVFHVWRYGAPGGTQFDLRFLDRLFIHLPLGVTLFFTLSGFLLYRPFAASMIRGEDRPGLGRYYRNRALRILPAYWAILLFAGIVLGTTYVRVSPYVLETGSLLRQPGSFARDALLIQNYSRESFLTGIGPAWSLAIELIFYLVLPATAIVGFVLAARSTSRRGRLVAALGPPLLLLAIGIAGKVVATFVIRGQGPGTPWIGDWHSLLERSFFLQADLFAWGMALAVLRIEFEDGRVHLTNTVRWLLAGGTIVLGAGTILLRETGSLGLYPYDTLTALACAGLLAIVVLPAQRPATSERRTAHRDPTLRALETRGVVWIGVISYSLFLLHEPLVRWIESHGLTVGGVPGFLLALVTVGAVALGLAALTYRFVEKPALSWRRSVRAGIPEPSAAQAPGGTSTDPSAPEPPATSPRRR